MTPIFRICLFLLLGSHLCNACQVPVFRYALERWRTDPYLVFVVAEGELVGEGKAAYTQLRELEEDFKSPANLYAEAINLSEEPVDSPFRKHVADLKVQLPAILAWYPEDRLDGPPIWQVPATPAHTQYLVESPVRREAIRRILSGDSAVWVMLESGNKTADDAAFNNMSKYLKVAAKDLKLPTGVLDAKQAQEALSRGQFFEESNVLQSEIPLKLEFSQMRFSRDDPKEKAFMEMLLNMEDDLQELSDEPMCFPVWDYCAYITGACSCEVKKQNPGIDLLTAMDWDAVIEGSEVIVEKILPPLEGVASLLSQPEVSQPLETATASSSTSLATPTSPQQTAPVSSSSRFNFVLVCITGAVAIGTFFILRKS
ncbi:MAG: hypothetical protein VXB01_00445 [Opitutae bacterium]